MIPEAKVKALVDAHRKLDEPTTGVIWIDQQAAEAWLVEIIPSMHDDERAHEPTYFTPGISFRFPLALIVGNLKSLKAAVERHPQLARKIAEGKVLHGKPAEHLRNLALALTKAA